MELEVRGQNGQSMYVTLFEGGCRSTLRVSCIHFRRVPWQDMLKEVISGEAELLVKEELDLFMDWHRLPCTPTLQALPKSPSNIFLDNVKYLFCRLLLRKTDKWHRYSSLKYEQELGADGILAAMQSLSRRRKDDVQEPEDVKPKLEDLNTNIPDLGPPIFKLEEDDIKPKLESVETTLPEEASKASKQPAPEIIDLTMDEIDEPPRAGPSSSPAIEPPPSSEPSSQSSARISDYTVFADDEEQAELFELLECVNQSELDDLAKQLKLKRPTVKKVCIV